GKGKSVVINGMTVSSDPFPTTGAAFQQNNGSQCFDDSRPDPNFCASSFDAFVTKLDAGGAMVYSTYLGGGGSEDGNGITVDPMNWPFVTGSPPSFPDPQTNKPSFPIGGAFVPYQSPLAGFQEAKPPTADASLAVLNTAGTALDYST